MTKVRQLQSVMARTLVAARMAGEFLTAVHAGRRPRSA